MTDTGWLEGTGDAPLCVTRQYSFRRGLNSDGEPTLTITVAHRGSWDDFGIVREPEQEVFVRRLLARLGVAARTGYPGEWVFADADALELAWLGLSETIGPPATSTSSATASRDVAKADAHGVSGGLTPRFLGLVSAVLGLDGEPFKCLESRIDNDGYEPQRSETWQRGSVVVKVEAVGIQSGHGVHGESCDYTTNHTSDGRAVRMYARIDMRSGGSYSVTVQGVRDAQALVDAFMAG